MKILAVALMGALVVAGSFYVGTLATGDAAAEVAPAAASPPPARVAFEDPAGDAQDLRATRLGYGPGCRLGCLGLPGAVASATGTEAPFLDLVEVAFEREEADAIVLSLTVDVLTEGFPELETPGTNRVAEYRACWEPSREHAVRCAVLTASTQHGEGAVSSTFHVFSEDCNEWAECAFDVPADVRYGEPGVVFFTVPKRYATYDGAPLDVATLRGYSGWYSANEAAPLWHAAYSLRHDGRHEHSHLGVMEPENRADVTDAFEAGLSLSPGDGSWAPVAAAPTLAAPHGALWGGGGPRDLPELDLLGVDLYEDGDDLVARYTVAGFEAMPDYSFHYITLVGTWGGLVHEFGVLREGTGDAYGYAGRCVAFECHDAHVEKVPMEVHAGAPGHVEIRVPKRVLGDPAPGTETNFLWAVTMYSEANVYVGEYGEATNGNVHAMSLVDGYLGGNPYVFGSGRAPAPMDAHTHGHR